MYLQTMPWGLKRFYDTGGLHFITWSCHNRQPLLASPARRDLLLKVLDQMQNRYRFVTVGYVVMPEHVHLLISEPLVGDISNALCAIKLGLARRVSSRRPHLWQNQPEAGHPETQPVWMKRFYDFNVWSQRKESEKLHYMHQNPVTRRLVERPEHWPWSSFLFYACGQIGPVRINDWSMRENKIRSTAS